MQPATTRIISTSLVLTQNFKLFNISTQIDNVDYSSQSRSDHLIYRTTLTVLVAQHSPCSPIYATKFKALFYLLTLKRFSIISCIFLRKASNEDISWSDSCKTRVKDLSFVTLFALFCVFFLAILPSTEYKFCYTLQFPYTGCWINRRVFLQTYLRAHSQIKLYECSRLVL